MRRIAILLIIGMMVTGILTACGAKTAGEPSLNNDTEKIGNADTGKIGKENDNKGITSNTIDFEKIDDVSELPANIQTFIQEIKNKRGFAYFKENGAYIMIITLGEKPSGGFNVKVEAVEDIEGITKVTVREHEPGPDDIVTMALTYPYTIVRIKGVTENFKVVNQKGEEFQLLSADEMTGKQQRITGTLNGQIDNNSVEIDIDDDIAIEGNDKPMAFIIGEEIRPYFNLSSKEYKDFKDGERIIFDFIRNDEGQNVLTRIEKL